MLLKIYLPNPSKPIITLNLSLEEYEDYLLAYYDGDFWEVIVDDKLLRINTQMVVYFEEELKDGFNQNELPNHDIIGDINKNV